MRDRLLVDHQTIKLWKKKNRNKKLLTFQLPGDVKNLEADKSHTNEPQQGEKETMRLGIIETSGDLRNYFLIEMNTNYIIKQQ